MEEVLTIQITVEVMVEHQLDLLVELLLLMVVVAAVEVILVEMEKDLVRAQVVQIQIITEDQADRAATTNQVLMVAAVVLVEMVVMVLLAHLNQGHLAMADQVYQIVF